MTRRASAPRLIDWTGERCVPWAPDVQAVYEHFHRYLWARSFVAGRTVLDLGSGEGFGAAILAEAADSVIGIDIDERTVEHARLRYADTRLSFATGDAVALTPDLEGRFDVVVAFEVLEHAGDHAALVDSVRRALRPGGLLIVSTPNRLLDVTGGGTPPHGSELSDTELDELLSTHFRSHLSFSQRVGEGSRIDPVAGGGELPPVRLERQGDEWDEVGPPPPYHLLAIAGDGDLPGGPAGSTLLDHSLGMLQRVRDDTRTQSSDAAEAHEGRLRAAQDELSAAYARVEELRAQRQEALRWTRATAVELIQERDRVELTTRERDALKHEVARIGESVTWRMFQRARREWRGSGPQPRLVARLTSAGLRWVARTRATRQQQAEEHAATTLPPPIVLSVPSSDTPDVSIIVPVYSGAELTGACLRSIVAATVDGPPYEVIVVDDCADAATKRVLQSVEGIRVIENPENIGFLRSVNHGAQHARGSTIVLLNNDTEPQPRWLEALMERLDSAPEIAAAGGRLIYPDNRLQEAGGVIFRDGSAINYGNGQDPGNAAYRYARPVDYCSAALLAIRTDVWRELGGFDEAYGPGYYEDVDLCFRLRALGHELWYEPAAHVIHKEGGSHGTDLTQGVKRYQVINQERFVERWGSELTERPPTADVEAGKLWADRRSGPVVLIVDHIIPEPDRDAGSLRMIHLIHELIAQGARVIFMPHDRQPTRGYTERLEHLGVEVIDYGVELHSRFLRLKEICRLVILSRPQVASPVLPEIRAALPNAQVVYDTVDLHWVREQMRGQYEDVPPGVPEAYREIELALVRGCDMTAVVTDVEQAAILAEVPDAQLRLIPVVQDIPAITPGRPGRSGLLFVGGFRHQPNVDAAVRLVDEVMPLLRTRRLELTATLAGPDAPPQIEAMAGADVTVTGWVPDIEPLLDRAFAMVAPLRYGAGMKGKVGQALARGLPVVTTAVGAQGFGLVDSEDALLAETPEEFADAIERLHSDPELWARLAAAGPEVVRRTCSLEMMADAVADLLASATAASTAGRSR